MPAKTLLVTGASRGIGSAISLAQYAQGATVIGMARRFPGIWQQQARLKPVEVDFSRIELLAQRLRALAKTYRSVDALILNAGIGRFAMLEEFSAEQIKTLIDINLTSQVLVLRQWLPALKRKGQGDVIIIGSTAALQGGQKGAVYAATKFGLRGLAQSLREECAAAGIRITLINPGMVQTDFYATQTFAPAAAEDCHLLPEDVATAVETVLSARPGCCYDEITLTPQKHVITFGKSVDR